MCAWPTCRRGETRGSYEPWQKPLPPSLVPGCYVSSRIELSTGADFASLELQMQWEMRQSRCRDEQRNILTSHRPSGQKTSMKMMTLMWASLPVVSDLSFSSRSAHHHVGAVDLLPFHPIGGATMEDAAEVARRVSKTLGEEMGLSVLTYGHAHPTRFLYLLVYRAGLKSLAGGLWCN